MNGNHNTYSEEELYLGCTTEISTLFRILLKVSSRNLITNEITSETVQIKQNITMLYKFL